MTNASRFFFLFGVLTVATQRLALPIGDQGFPIMSLIALLAAAVALRGGLMSLSPARLICLLALAGVGGIGAILMVGTSAASLLLVLVLWAPATLSPVHARNPRAMDPALGLHFLGGVFWATVIGALVAILQSVVSAMGGRFIDPIGALPADFLLQGFNTTYPVSFGSSWLRSNGGWFLEPSMLSLFGALALLLLTTGVVRIGRWTGLSVVVLIAAIMASVATSGLVVLPFILIAAARSNRGRLALVAGAVALAVSAASVPLVRLFIEKADIGDASASGNTSFSQRLVLPYLELGELFSASPWIGLGPGAARTYADAQELGVTTPTLMKIIVEYGLLGLVLFLTVLGTLFVSSRLPGLVKLGILASLIVPTDGLTSGHLVPLALFALILSSASTKTGAVRFEGSTRHVLASRNRELMDRRMP